MSEPRTIEEPGIHGLDMLRADIKAANLPYGQSWANRLADSTRTVVLALREKDARIKELWALVWALGVPEASRNDQSDANSDPTEPTLRPITIADGTKGMERGR